MAAVTCSDGSVLDVRPVPVLARDGVAYEMTLSLTRDGAAFGEVGERCWASLAALAARLRVGDLTGAVEAGVRAAAERRGVDPDEAWEQVRRDLPRDHVLLALRSRSPDDLPGAGELHVSLRDTRRWRAGRWELDRSVVLDAWGGDDGATTGVRAVLTMEALRGLLDDLLDELFAEAERAGLALR